MGGYSRSSQSSTSISPSVSMSSGRLAVLKGAGFARGCVSPLCSSCSGLEMAAGPLPGAWLSLGWTGGARGATGRLWATKVSWLFEKDLRRQYGYILSIEHISSLKYWKLSQLYSGDLLILGSWFIFFCCFRRPGAESRGSLFQLDLFQILEQQTKQQACINYHWTLNQPWRTPLHLTKQTDERLYVDDNVMFWKDSSFFVTTFDLWA